MKASIHPILNSLFKVILILAFVYYTNQGFKDRLTYLTDYQNYSTLAVFAVLWASSIIILFIVGFQQNFYARLFWGFVIAVTTAISYGFYSAGGSELEVLDVFELWQAKHETGRALSHFSGAAIKAVIVALIGLLIFVYPPPKLSKRISKYLSLLVWLPLIPMFLFSSLVFLKSDRAVAGLPQQFSPAAMAIAISYKSIMHEMPQRKAVNFPPESQPKTKHLLYLVDESINPKYLFSDQGEYLKGLADHKDKIADFGVAVSGSNCSARSNAILRLGATRENLIQSVKTNPSVWQYAKKAGYRTVYIDSQASDKVIKKPNDFQNYMNSTEASLIDVFYKVKNVPDSQLDYELLKLVKKELAHKDPTFIYANKNGAHFPYSDNYPETESKFLPVVTTAKDHSFGSLMALYNGGEGLQAVINTYKNSLHWNVDRFFQQFFDEIDLTETVVFYTSDHGQYFDVSKTTHCTSGEGAPVEEGLVPLMLMSGNKKLVSEFNKAAKANFNKMDHFSIFPTMLNLLGYSKQHQNSYGPTLFDTAKGRMSAFNTGDILGIITTDTMWREVTSEERTATGRNQPNQKTN